MIGKILKKVVGTKNDRELKRMGKMVARVNALADEIAALDDSSLQAKSAEFRQRFVDSEAVFQDRELCGKYPG